MFLKGEKMIRKEPILNVHKKICQINFSSEVLLREERIEITLTKPVDRTI